MNRREFLTATAALTAGSKVLSAMLSARESILSRIKPPTFPKRDFDITKYGAVNGGEKDCTGAIRDAIAACTAAGGGRVVVPAGVFLTGAVHLESNVELHVAEGATLRFSRDPKQYLPVVLTRWEGTECMNYSPFIYAFEKANIAITGTGTLDGQADAAHWWDFRSKHDNDRKALMSMGDKGVPVKDRVFGDGHYLRPYFVQPYRCANILIEGVKVINSPMWELNPVLCRNVTVRNVHIDTHGPNNDGCDPDSCTDMLIEKCTFSTGDDCIAIKSGRNADGRRVNAPTSNLLIRDCDMQDGHGGVSIGSEASGGINNVFVENCRMSSPHLQRALRIKTNSYRGGTIENITFRDVQVGEVAEAVIEIDFFYEEGEGGPFKPIVRNVLVSDVTSKKSKYGLYLHGYKDDPIRGLTVTNCHFENAANGDFKENVA
ncbi:MAG TPA: glycoside hydrolase family 28 protein [Bryobacteraceae bacterium]|nr:glycoside hydrolase family 28 protein [Bryobacteraceae bacterium]